MGLRSQCVGPEAPRKEGGSKMASETDPRGGESQSPSMGPSVTGSGSKKTRLSPDFRTEPKDLWMSTGQGRAQGRPRGVPSDPESPWGSLRNTAGGSGVTGTFSVAYGGRQPLWKTCRSFRNLHDLDVVVHIVIFGIFRFPNLNESSFTIPRSPL